MRLRTPAGDVEARCPEGVRAGEVVSVSVRPENIRVSAEPLSGPNVLEGVLEQQFFLGEFLDCHVRVGAMTLLCRQHPTVRFHRNDAVWVEIPAALCVVLSDEHGVVAEYDGGDSELESDQGDPDASSLPGHRWIPVTASGDPDGEVVVNPSPPPAPAEALATLERIGLATASSALPPMVLRARVLDGHAFHRIGGRGAIAGTVVTAWNVWGRSPLNAKLFEMLRPGDVLVVAGDTSRALWGDVATHRAMRREVRAAIVDGCVRDVDAVAATGFSVWAARIFVGEGSRTGGPGAINVPLTIRGLSVEPGDVVVADGDGIGFLPRAMLDEIVAAAEDREREDRRVIAELATNERPSN